MIRAVPSAARAVRPAGWSSSSKRPGTLATNWITVGTPFFTAFSMLYPWRWTAVPVFVRTTSRTVLPFLTEGRAIPPTGLPFATVTVITTGLTAATWAAAAVGTATATSATATMCA